MIVRRISYAVSMLLLSYLIQSVVVADTARKERRFDPIGVKQAQAAMRASRATAPLSKQARGKKMGKSATTQALTQPTLTTSPSLTASPGGKIIMTPFYGGVSSSYYVPPHVVAVDLDNDGDEEAVVMGNTQENGQGKDYIWAFHGDGKVVKGFPITGPTKYLSNFSISKTANLITATSLNYPLLLAWDLQGKLKSGFPKKVIDDDEFYLNSTAIADVNGDGSEDIIIVTEEGVLYVVQQNGITLPGFPTAPFYLTPQDQLDETPVYLQAFPAIGDINNDGANEIVVASDDHLQFAFTATGTLLNGWPGGSGNPDRYFAGSPVLADLKGNSTRVIVANTVDGDIITFNPNNTKLWKRTVPNKAALWTGPIVGLLNTAKPQIVTIDDAGNQSLQTNARLFRLEPDGDTSAGFPTFVSGGDYSSDFGPLISDVDGDSIPEILMTDVYGSNINAFTVDGESHGGMLPKPIGTGTSITPVNSAHPYADSFDQTWVINNVSTAQNTAVYFSKVLTESDLDYVYIIDPATDQVVQEITGEQYVNGGWSASVPGNKIKVRLVTDESVQDYGFQITKVIDEQLTVPISDFPIMLDTYIWGLPAVGNFDADPKAEIAVVTQEGMKFIQLQGVVTPATRTWSQLHLNSAHTGNYK
jgi:hypothetical protein